MRKFSVTFTGIKLRKSCKMWKEKSDMYDKLFPPAKFTLPNGKVVYQKRSRAPLIILLVIIGIFLSIHFTHFSFQMLVSRWREFFVIIGDMIPPNWSHFSNILQPLVDTIKMSILGSVMGSIVAVPAA